MMRGPNKTFRTKKNEVFGQKVKKKQTDRNSPENRMGLFWP